MTPLYPGQITDVAGLMLGHYSDTRRPTGCSVVLCPHGAVAGVDVRGAAPGTRETDLLAPGNLVEQVHAIVLAGGSAYGLDAASGVMRWLEEHGHGLPVGPAVVPIVPAAVLFDLWVGDASIRPDAAAGYAASDDAVAASAAHHPRHWGNVGAGSGATVGKLFGPQHGMKGGIGSASLTVGGVTVAALMAVNAVGDIRDPSTGRLIAGARNDDGLTLRDIQASFVAGRLPGRRLPVASDDTVAGPVPGANTTIGIVATDARLDKAQARRLATEAHDGLARCIWPAHTAFDGDTVFALATGSSSASLPPEVLGTLAAEVTARAVLNAVRAARGLDNPALPSASDLGLA
ncbi:MAG: P1 family peptidase [Burkholderiales bacterium]|nr:P1 family peptidase [Burkholderiales bacterium]